MRYYEEHDAAENQDTSKEPSLPRIFNALCIKCKLAKDENAH